MIIISSPRQLSYTVRLVSTPKSAIAACFLLVSTKKVMAKEFKSRSSDGLQAVHELVTPLSVAVECSNPAEVKMLLPEAFWKRFRGSRQAF